MTEALAHLGSVSRQYQQSALEFENVLIAAAQAEAAYKSARARRILRALDSEDRMSHARAETIADADDEIAALYQHRLITQAKADAHRAQLNQLREQVQSGRTFAASERAVDQIHAEGRGGAA